MSYKLLRKPLKERKCTFTIAANTTTQNCSVYANPLTANKISWGDKFLYFLCGKR